jgi:TPR repeat protein
MSARNVSLGAALAVAWLAALGAAPAGAQALRPTTQDEPTLRASAKAQIEKGLKLFDARHLIRLPQGRFERPPSDSESDRIAARELFLSAGFAGDADARDYAARMAQAGIGGRLDLAEARRLYEESGTRAARWRLAGMLERGEGGPKDLASARKLYKLASDMGQIDARYDFARMAYAGEGGPVDHVGARAALVTAARYCHGDAADLLGRMAERGEGGERDVRLAAASYLRAVDCSGKFYKDPTLVWRWEAVARDVREEVQRVLIARGMTGIPEDGSQMNAGWHKVMPKRRTEG